MPTITDYIAGKGTVLSDSPDPSSAGHMWFTLNPGNGGAVESYGFAPVVHKSPNPFPVVGEVKKDDNTNYLSHEYARTIEVTQAQYDALKSFANDPVAYGFDKSSYWAPTNSCVDFVWKALQVAGLNHTGYEGSLWPTDNKEDMRKFVDLSPIEIKRIDDFLKTVFPQTWEPIISPTLGTTPDPLVKTIRYVDPLILDLDGDGLKITPLSKGILFDANGDSIKTGTAWAGADDGMLVWDRNANGVIDSGAEFFGDETLLANGQKASHGFAALSDLDKGSLVNNATVGAGDGVFDAKDAQYANPRIWRDMNQNGISQADELQTLADSGVKSISLTNTTVNTSYTDAILAQSGNFTRMDDSTGQAGSFILAQNNFVRAFVPIAVSADAKALNNVGGSGWVRDLQEAATQSPELIGFYNQIKNTTTREGSHVACVQ